MTTRAAAPLTDAIAAHHAEMETELRQRVDDLITVVARGEPHAEATGRVGHRSAMDSSAVSAATGQPARCPPSSPHSGQMMRAQHAGSPG
jgi:hypothetical protein